RVVESEQLKHGEQRDQVRKRRCHAGDQDQHGQLVRLRARDAVSGGHADGEGDQSGEHRKTEPDLAQLSAPARAPRTGRRHRAGGGYVHLAFSLTCSNSKASARMMTKKTTTTAEALPTL